MNIEEIREFCLNLPFTSESFPFNEDVLVFKLFDKMFLLCNLKSPNKISVKCKPELAIELREKYSFVSPAYHMNKKHWNTIEFDNNVNDDFIFTQIKNSYNLVKENLTKTQKQKIQKYAQ